MDGNGGYQNGIYHLIMTKIAMERSTIFKFGKLGKPSISMGHLYHGYVSHNQRGSNQRNPGLWPTGKIMMNPMKQWIHFWVPRFQTGTPYWVLCIQRNAHIESPREWSV